MTQHPHKKARHPLKPVDAEVLNAPGAAALLSVSSRLILRLARQGKIPGKKVGKEWRFRRAAILQWLGKTESPPPEWIKGMIAGGKATPLPPNKR